MARKKKQRKQRVVQKQKENIQYQEKLLAQVEPAKYRLRMERVWLVLGFILILGGVILIANGLSSIFQKGPQESADLLSKSVEPSITPGNINDGASIIRARAAGLSALEKAEGTAMRIKLSGKWQATDYEKGDIGVGSYEVKLGDTLWEIAEAVYGDGFQWNKILNLNKEKIGFLPNGSQALIFPGQVLIIPK